MNQESTIKYRKDVVENSFFGTRVISTPTHRVYAGAWDMNFDVSVYIISSSSYVQAAQHLFSGLGQLYMRADSGTFIKWGAADDCSISRISAGILAIGTGASGSEARTLQLTSIDVRSGGSTTISTGVGSVKMSSVNAATNTAWIPIAYAGTTYYVPAYTTNAP